MAESASVKFRTRINRLSHLPGHFLEIPAHVARKVGGLNKQRLVCTVNKTVKWQCGMVALGGGKGYILLNKKLMSEGDLRLGQQVSVELQKDRTAYGMTVPEELAELFAQDKEGKKRFDGLAPGKQRYIIYYIKQVKSPLLRAERAVWLIGNLKGLPKGKETFVALFAKRN